MRLTCQQCFCYASMRESWIQGTHLLICTADSSIHLHTHKYNHIHALIHTYMHKHMNTYDVRTYVQIGMHACIHTHIHLYMHTYIHTYLLLLISMLWHRQAIFQSKGDKLSSSAECRIRTQMVSETQSPADWMPADKPTELSRIKLKLELDSLSLWSASIQPTWDTYIRTYVRTYIHTYLRTYVRTTHVRTYVHAYMLVANFDALAQASDIRI